jgi:hypothetical protein
MPDGVLGLRSRKRQKSASTTMQTAATTPRRAPIAATALLLLATSAARACPMCKDGAPVDAHPTAAAADAPAPAAASLDFNGSIYVMLGVMAVVGTAVGRAMVKATRQR